MRLENELRILRVFDSRVIRKTEQVTGDCRKYHSEELHDLYCSPNITQLTTERKVRYGVCGAYGRNERCLEGLGGET